MLTAEIPRNGLHKSEPASVCKVWDADYPWDVRVEKICRSLCRAYDVHLVSRNSKRRSTYERHGNLHIHRLPVVPSLPPQIAGALGFPAFFNPLWIRAIERTARLSSARVLIARDLPLALATLLVGRIHRIPVIFDMAENYPAMLQDVWDSAGARIGDRLMRNPRLARVVERVAVRLADHILVVVDESRTRLLEMGVPSRKMTVVMNTPDLSRGQQPAHDSSRGLARNPRELIVVYLGLLEVPRGLGTAILAMREVRRQLPNARLVVIGSGRDEELFRKQARVVGVNDRVEFRGWVEYRQALDHISNCDIGLVPHHATVNWQTTSPNKLFDYMSLGKPVIVSSARPTARIVAEEQCGLVFSDRNPRELADAIVRLSDPSVRNMYGNRGQEAVRRQYNWETDERRLLGAIQNVIAEREFSECESATRTKLIKRQR